MEGLKGSSWHSRPYPHPAITCSGWCIHGEAPRQVISRCPSTHKHDDPFWGGSRGVQCKYLPLHNGRHCGYINSTIGDVFWD